MLCLISTILAVMRRRRLESALKRYRAEPTARRSIALAQLLYRCGHDTKALRVIGEACARHPDNAAVERTRQQLRARQADANLRRLVRLASSDPHLGALARGCDLAGRLGQFKTARKFVAAAQKHFPDLSQSDLIAAKYHFHRFNAKKQQGDLNATLEYLQSAYALDPQDYEVLFLYTLTLARSRDFETAQIVAAELQELYPHDDRVGALLSHIEAAQSTGSDASQADAVALGDAAAVMSSLIEIEGSVGVFLFDGSGELVDQHTVETDTFSFAEGLEPIQAMLRTCMNDANRIGIGELNACLLCGDEWQAIVRSRGNMHVVGFFECYPHGEVLEQEIDQALTSTEAAA